MTVHISDVAALAGVSRTTVSHAISGKRTVGQDVYARVFKAMDELGYVPSRSARNLALGRTQILGLLVPDIANGFFAELAKGVEATAIAAGYNVIIGNTGFDRERELMYFEMIRSRAVDGILYAAGSAVESSEIMDAVGDLPLVLVDEELADFGGCTVVSDNYDGGRQAAQFLLSLGHKNALVLGAPQTLLSGARRAAGFTEAWKDGGGETVVVELGAFTQEAGLNGVRLHRAALSSGEITAIFAVNDLMALGAIKRLRELGISVPGQVSVMGFDDIPLAELTDPGLTTVRQDVGGLGARATTLLIDALAERKALEERHEVQEVQLIRRGTTGPVLRDPKGATETRGTMPV